MENIEDYIRKSKLAKRVQNIWSSINNIIGYSLIATVEIDIPDSVTTIADNTFESCTHLTRVNIPDSVETIGSYAFTGCRELTDVTIATRM